MEMIKTKNIVCGLKGHDTLAQPGGLGGKMQTSPHAPKGRTCGKVPQDESALAGGRKPPDDKHPRPPSSDEATLRKMTDKNRKCQNRRP